MRIFLDTEFIDSLRQPIQLLSIGLVANDGREYYAINAESTTDKANTFVRRMVLPQIHEDLKEHPEYEKPLKSIASEIQAFASEGGERPEFWAYMGSFDYVVLTHVFGGMTGWPKGWPYYFNDIEQERVRLGVSKLPEGKGEHHALADARWVRDAWVALHHAQESS